MKDIILAKLNEIEEREGVKILYAAEAGSRAWGFASDDSDYDVRFIYVRPMREYLRLCPARDVIEWQLDETLDINGWDLKKALTLLLSSNPALFEWAGSPAVYLRTEEWEEIATLLPAYFDPKKAFHHYLSMAKHNYVTMEQEGSGGKVKYKKYLYVLRALLACRWIEERGTASPVPFAELVAAELPAELKEDVEELLRRKRGGENVAGEKNPRFEAFLEKEFAESAARAARLSGNRKSVAELDELFLRILSSR